MCDEALSIVKFKLVSSRVLVHYDPELPLCMASDALLNLWCRRFTLGWYKYHMTVFTKTALMIDRTGSVSQKKLNFQRKI